MILLVWCFPDVHMLLSISKAPQTEIFLIGSYRCSYQDCFFVIFINAHVYIIYVRDQAEMNEELKAVANSTCTTLLSVSSGATQASSLVGGGRACWRTSLTALRCSAMASSALGWPRSTAAPFPALQKQQERPGKAGIPLGA